MSSSHTGGPRARPAVPGTRSDLITGRRRNAEWKKEPRRIEPAECIGCDSCMRACPPQFDAVFNLGLDVVIVPELCNGCGKCVQACPVDCIYPDPGWKPTEESLWTHIEGQERYSAGS